MIQMLFSLLFLEGFLVLVMIVKTPLRKLAIMGLDRMKRGRGPTVVKTIAATFFAVLISSIYSMAKIQTRSVDLGSSMSPTDQVLMSRHLLEASLMGFSMFLALIIDRLHHYLRELRLQRKSIEALKAQTRGFEDGKGWGSDLKGLLEEIASMEAKIKQLRSEDETKASKSNEIANLKAKIKQLESEATAKSADTNDIVSLKALVCHLESKIEEKEKEAKTRDANTMALKKQLEGFHVEYDRLFKENQDLRCQLKCIDRRLSDTDGKKNIHAALGGRGENGIISGQEMASVDTSEDHYNQRDKN